MRQTLGLLSLFGWCLPAMAHTLPAPASHDFHWYLNANSSSARYVADCGLAGSSFENCYFPRATPTVRVLLMQYGTYSTVEDLKRIGNLLAQRFQVATDGALGIEFVDYAVVPLSNEPHDFSDFIDEVKGDHSPERLNRLWYYYHKDVYSKDPVVNEVKRELIKQGYEADLQKVDATLVLSEAQFEGLGYATGGFGITEQPTEIAWASSVGFTQKNTDAQIVDELLHELGHVLGLDHSAKQCIALGDYKKVRECCDQSPSGTDVMSYCRERGKVDDTFFFQYSQCTRDYLKNVTVPALLNGGKRPFQPSACQ